MIDLQAFTFSSSDWPAGAKVVDVSPSSATKAELIKDLATSLGVPDYFGANWDALDESLRDLNWVAEHSVVIRHTALPPVPVDVLRMYLDVLARAVRSWRNAHEHELFVTFPPAAREEVTLAAQGNEMTYSIIQPPFTLTFREMPKAELRAYKEWFMKALAERVAGLEAEVQRTPKYGAWIADRSPESLERLGDWFARKVETRAKTGEEIEAVKAKLTFPIEVPGEQLTNRTFSLAMDIGMYFGETVLKNLSGTRWDQPLQNERFADYGQPVIMGFGSVPLNPVRIVVMLAYGIASGKQGGRRLRELYDTWAKMKRS